MNHSKSSLFLMELITAILFFSLASAVCIQLFSKSHLIGLETVNQNNAIIQAQNLAESWYTAEGDLFSMKTLLPESAVSNAGDSISLSFDKEWEMRPAGYDRGYPAYMATLTSSGVATDDLITADISVYPFSSSDKPLYSLQLCMHVAKRRGGDE